MENATKANVAVFLLTNGKGIFKRNKEKSLEPFNTF